MSLEATRWMDEEMARAMADAKASGWSEEGQIVFIRRRIEAAYDKVRRNAR